MNELEKYFLEHPDEEEEFIEEMARLRRSYEDNEIDYPEDWDLGQDVSLEEWAVYA